ncbi:unnamed protein product [Triticum turgidum subsp. durum]|uniref:Uncharacterized protein n=1 Tax=Triticum turgidum subsp. durum TaxID=4567 RepID=A0A9R0VRU8_TRITD|nr:unnamed protein product [Triticum turgidum subsp. durum]
MAEIVKSVIVGEAVSRIISGIAPTSKRPDRSVEEAAGGYGLERLEMARIKMEAALHTSDKWQITSTSLLHWRKKLKRAAQDCDDVARRCRQLFREEEEAEQVVRQSSFPRQMAHATKVFISSLVGHDNDHCSANSTTAAAVRRFDKLADGASEFMSFVQLGGTPWFRPDPLCCQGYEHDVVPSCHISSDNARGNKLKFSSIFPEPACGVFLWRHISVSEYSDLPGSTVVVAHDDTSSLENSPSLKLGIMFLPHDSLEDPKSDGSAIEVIDTESSHHLTYVTLPLDQLDKMLIPKATEYLRHNVKAMMYQVCWRSNHGSAHLCVEKAIAEKQSEVRRATRQGRNIKSTKGLSQVKHDWEVRLRNQGVNLSENYGLCVPQRGCRARLPHGSIGLD